MKRLINKLFGRTSAAAETEAVSEPAAAVERQTARPEASADDGSAPNSSRKRRRSRRPRSDSAGTGDDERAQTPPNTQAATRIPDWRPPGDDSIAKVPGKTRFIDLDLPPELLRGICDLGFEYCTPVQQSCIPITLDGKDLAGKAQTGTGKTAAFLISTLTRLIRNPVGERKPGSVRALVLAPTRELAIQIHKDAQDLSCHLGFHNEVVFGGMDHRKQRESLEEPVDILVGTPGRLIDYSRGRHLDLHHVEVLVIDEADRMLDMGFIPDVRRIISQLPQAHERQTLLFSATFTDDILKLASRWQVSPQRVEIDAENVVAELIDERLYSVVSEDRLAVLLWVLKNEPVERMLIFLNRKDACDKLYRQLYSHGVDAGLLSGDVDQKKRLRILDDFRNGTTKVVVATDVAGRGIHVENISHVVNYDLPYEVENYVHRIGRTGRAGASGHAISLVCEFGGYLVPEIEEYLGRRLVIQQAIPEMLALPEPVREMPRSERRPSPGRGGGRPGGRPGGPPRSGRRPDSRRPRPTGGRSGNRGSQRGR